MRLSLKRKTPSYLPHDWLQPLIMTNDLRRFCMYCGQPEIPPLILDPRCAARAGGGE